MKQVAIVTGGATGIGQAIAQALVNQGMNVVIAGRNQQRGEATAKELGDTAFFVQADVSQEADVQHLVAATLERYGRLDYLINSAGIECGSGGFEDTSAELLDDVLSVNVKGVFLTMKHAIPLMLLQQAGTIINIASFVGTTMPIASAAIYGASKAAVLSLTRAAAAGYADQHLRVYAVCPWMTETPMAKRLSGPDPDAMARYATDINPSGQLATPADIAQAVADLLMGRTELPNGEAMLVDHASALSRITPMTVAE
ncbi:MAG: SDR family oxidoreductase [Bacteroidota bacterium]|nr:SDR family oxidoreductase [Bacteroidota bacterium]